MNATITPMRTSAENALIERFGSFKNNLPGDASVQALREKAFAPIQKIGLPNRRVEAYKYTDLRALLKDVPPVAPEVQGEALRAALAAPLTLSAADAHVVRFINGYCVQKPALPEGLDLMPLHEALKSAHPAVTARLGKEMAQAGDDPLAGLNTAFMNDGLFIRVPAGTDVKMPLIVDCQVLAKNPVSVFPRLVVIVEKGAKLALIESYSGPAGVAYQNHAAVEITIGDDAQVDHVRIYGDGDAAFSFSTLANSLGAHAIYNTAAFAVGPQMARHQVFTTFAGRDANAGIHGVTLLRGDQHADHTLNVDHAEPGGVSRELFRSVIDDVATGVFQGKIVVRQKAQKTDGRMASNALLLGETATMNNKPELEIFADDVQCAHGATCAALDHDLLFYLMARGISRREAEALMIESFAGEALESIGHDGVRDALMARIGDWLAKRV